MVTGILGGFSAGWISDKLFHSRRGPVGVIMNAVMAVGTIAMAVFLFTAPLAVGISVSMIALAVIGVHSIMSGTASADFGGRKATGTAAGIIDASVYFGSGLQSISLGYITGHGWHFWPLFLIPFAFIGLWYSMKMWHAIPAATKRYLATVEKVTIVESAGGKTRIRSKETVTVEPTESS